MVKEDTKAEVDNAAQPQHGKKDSIAETKEFFEAIKVDEKDDKLPPIASSSRRNKQVRNKKSSIASK